MQPHEQEEEVVYDLVELRQLPLVDIGKSLKNKLKRTTMLLYFAVFPIGAAVFTIAAKHVRLMAPVKFSLQIPFLVSMSAGLRVDILWCLFSTYDFWFFIVTNAITALCVCADAKVNDPRVAGAAALTALYHVFLLVIFGLRLTPDAHSVVLFDNNGYSMTSNDVLLNSFSTILHSAWRIDIAIRVFGAIDFALDIIAFAGSHAWSKSKLASAPFLALSLASLLCTLSFCAILVGLYQRQLLKRLASSFDFAFITAQNTLAYLAVCDMYSWGPRCVPIVTGWAWLVWLLTLDALTPAARSAVRIYTTFATPVLLFAIFVQCYTLYQILFADSTDLQD
ncbi:hypothetical protein PybrP1_001229 [[Pythium] brassicae (nom. inval.)]|nr:hypothetical protein PybrP1_001229 [[Pythium] brassicae (nom. inval.)]